MKASVRWASRILLGMLGLSSSGFGHGLAVDRLQELSHEIEHRPSLPALYLARGRIHLDSGRWDAALADFEKSLEVDPTYHEALYWQGEALFRKGSAPNAERILRRYLIHVPHSPDGHRMIGLVYAHLGERLRAADHFDLAIDSDASSPPQVFLDRAEILLQLDPIPLERIRTGLNAGLKSHQANIALIEKLIEADLAVRRYDLALADLQKLPVQLQTTPHWMNRRAEIESLRGRSDEAEKWYRTALDRIGSLPASRQRLPAYAAIRTRAERALQHIRRRDTAAPVPALPD